MIWSRLKLRFAKETSGKHEKSHVESLTGVSNVNEEYLEVFRTSSFIEICSKVQASLIRRSLDKLSSSSSLPRHVHLSECLLEPCQQTLADIVEGSELNRFLSGFLQISLGACKICELILKSIQRTKANYSPMRRVINQLKRITDDKDYTDHQCKRIYGSLAAFQMLINPLSTVSPVQFQELHDNLNLSLDIFTSQRRKIRRRRKFVKCCKRIAGGTVIAACSAATITLTVLAIHSVIGMVAAPCLIASSAAVLTKRIRQTKKEHKTTYLKRLEAQLDTAAKGMYLLINDFNTMGRLVMRLNDEMEHSRFIADLCLRRRKNEMLKEVVKEFRINETGIMNQLEELEEHVYMCILNISRSRRLLVEKMVEC